MKIAYLMQTGVPNIRSQTLSGPAIHVQRVFHELQVRGHNVVLLCQLDGHIYRSDDMDTYTPVTIRWLDQGPLRLMERGIRRIQSEFRLPYAGLFESIRFALACCQEAPDADLFYERMGWMGYGGALAARWSGTPLVLEVNGDHLDELHSLGIAPVGLQRFFSVRSTHYAAQQAAFAVATGEGWRQRFVERWQTKPDRVAVVENGSDIVDLLPRERLQAFAPVPSADRAVTVTYLGAFEPWHGLSVLLDAFADAFSHNQSLRLVLIGEGTEMDALRGQTDRLGIKDAVTFTGHLSITELAEQLAQSDIAVSPYCGRVEFSGLKLLDYKAAGLPTIASGQDGQPALITHQSTGWIVPPCDVNALAHAITALAADRPTRQRMGQQARTEAEQCHSWRHTTEELEKIFLRVAASS